MQSPHPLARRRVADCSGDVIPPAQHHPVCTSDSRHCINKVIGATIGGNFGKRRNLGERSQIGLIYEISEAGVVVTRSNGNSIFIPPIPVG